MSDLIEQASRDLRWLYDCPDLLETPLSLSLPDPFASGPELDFSPVERFLATKASYRVGYYVESLIQVWLLAIPGITEVQHGIQIRREKETLGELDFLYRHDGQWHHLEVALKFYLYSRTETVAGSHFIGPNAADTLERKRDRLLQQQIPLGKRFYPEIVESHLMVKGLIFYSPGEAGPSEWPVGLNPEHARGIWVRENGASKLLADRSGVPLRKPFWLSGRSDRVSEEEKNGMASIQRGRPKFIALEPSEGRGKSLPGDRLFVVPESWPAVSR